MAFAERSAVGAARRIADELDRAEIPYAIGGALALTIAGIPRGTADVDVNVERTRIRVTDDGGWSGWFLSAEALAVFKWDEIVRCFGPP